MAPSARGSAPVDPEKALRLFGLTRSATLRELNSSFRRVVKKYHPDFNPDRQKWAHNAMLIVNSAYEWLHGQEARQSSHDVQECGSYSQRQITPPIAILRQ